MNTEGFPNDKVDCRDIREQEVSVFANEAEEKDKKENPKKLELTTFSKRYSAFYRDEIAQKIKDLRLQNSTNLKNKPIEIADLKISIETDESAIDEAAQRKMTAEELQIALEEEMTRINSEIEEIKNNLAERKKSLIYKVKKLFSSDQSEITEEVVNILLSEGLTAKDIKTKQNQEDFNIIQTIKDKKDLLKKTGAALTAVQQELNDSDELIKKVELLIKDKYQAIDEAEKIINSDSEVREIEQTINTFYSEIEKQKSQFETERTARSVAHISKEKNVLFCHSIIMDIIKDSGFSQNNKVVNTDRLGPEEKIKMILGLEPTISVSTINNENQELARNFGVILGDGQVLSAYGGDAASLLHKSIYSRKPKYDPSLKTSIIQASPEKNINEAINHQVGNDSAASAHQGWNEIIVENPKVTGLFFQSDSKSGAFGNINYAKKISKDLNLPLYIFNSDKAYKINKETDKLVEISREDILNQGKDLLPVERRDMINEVIDKESFYTKRENVYKFNGYSIGRAYYRFIKRIDSGEKILIKKIGDNSELLEGDEIIRLFESSYAITNVSLNERDWERWGGYCSKKDNNKQAFNYQFVGQNVWEPKTDFTVSDDSILSYIDFLNQELARLKRQEDNYNPRQSTDELSIRTQSILFTLFGVMKESQESGDIKNYETAKSIIEKHNNPEKYEDFIKKRVGPDNDFKYSIDDAPIEIRKKLKELSRNDLQG